MPFVVPDAQNQNKTSKVAVRFALVPTWFAGKKYVFKTMAKKWL